MAGATLQVLLEMLGKVQGFEGRVELDSPRCVFGCVEASARIVFSEPVLQISRVATIDLLRLRDALENVGVEHAVPSSPGARSWKARKGLAWTAPS